MEMFFTPAEIRALELPPKRCQANYVEKLIKGRALILSLSYAGTKTWRVGYYVKGKPKSRKIGYYPHMGIKAAREAALAFKPETEIDDKPANSFKAIADKWVVQRVDGDGLRSAYEIKRRLNKHVLPVWGARAITSITREDVDD